MSQADRELTRRFWSGTPTGALVPPLAAVFFTFTAIGFLLDIALVTAESARPSTASTR